MSQFPATIRATMAQEPATGIVLRLAAKPGDNFRECHRGRQRNERCRPIRERRFVRVDFYDRDALFHRYINEPGGGIDDPACADDQEDAGAVHADPRPRHENRIERFAEPDHVRSEGIAPAGGASCP